MNEQELAKYLKDTLKNYNPYEFSDTEYSEEQALSDIKDNPLVTIENLLTIINDLIA